MNARLILAISCLAAMLTAYADLHEDIQRDIARLERRTNAENLRVLTARALGTDAQEEAMLAIRNAFRKQMGQNANPKLPTRNLKLLTETADALLLLSLAQQGNERTNAYRDLNVKQWLLLNPRRRTDLLSHLDPQRDRFPRVLQIIWLLRNHDPQKAAQNWPLILAMALVWDSPRPPLHDQIGPAMMAYRPELTQRYDFFKDVLTERTAPFNLSRLSIPALCFVVDTPVPVAELAWARDHVKERDPEDLFASIHYDTRRLTRATPDLQFDPDRPSGSGKASLYWPYGPYSLENILNHGGICTDQAYVTALTLRARGIPAILLVGMGRRGGHAWVAYMKSARQWKTDVGRPKEDSYTTGHARLPQTGVPFNDHVLPLICQRLSSFNQPQHAQAMSLTRLALVLHSLNRQQAAQDAAELAVKADSRNLRAWELLAQTQDTHSGLLNVLQLQERQFQKYPDLVTSFRLQQARLLRERGHRGQADQLLQNMPLNARRRDDLSQDVAFEQIQDALRNNQPEKARLILEKHLRSQRKEAVKTLNNLQFYLRLTQETNQTDEAVDFLRRYLRSLGRSFDKYAAQDPSFRNWDTLIMIKAYENNGDLKKAQRLTRKLD